MHPAICNKVRTLLAERRVGHTLPQPFYIDPDIFEFDLQTIFHRGWLQVALASEVPRPGDYVTMTIGRSPIVIVRDHDHAIRGFFNTCRHRGAQICQEARGRLSRFVCPYHQWAYALSGALVHAALMPEEFDIAGHGLRPLHVETVAGVIHVCLADVPPDFEPLRTALEPLLEPHELNKGKVAHTDTLTVRANWKLVMENARECYHCRARHPQLMRAFHDFSTAGVSDQPEPWLREFWSRCEGKGLQSRPVAGPWFDIGRYPLAEGAVSLTSDGKPAVARTLGSVGDGDVGTLRWTLQPNCFNHAFGDYAFLFQALPTGVQETTITAKWVVDKEAVEGVDYDLQRLTEIWTITDQQDQWLAENSQRGVNSVSYVPGPYSPSGERWVAEFTDWYCVSMANALNE